MLSFTIGASSITVFLDGIINTIDTSHINHPFLLEELRRPPEDRDLDAIRTYISVKKMIERFTDGRVTITEMDVIFDGSPIANHLAERMLAVLEQGIDVEPYAKFMANVMSNPARYTHDELFEWLEKGRMPITEDGCFIAFKKVRDDYTDCHTGRFSNTVGSILEMDRNHCNPNRHQTCSTGFHFCSPGYLRSFGGQRVMVVKVNPRDVTSIPSDYQFTKGRTCRYEVIQELADESAAHHEVWRTPVMSFEDPTEFPPEMVAALVPADAVEEAAAAIEAEQIDVLTGDGSGEALPPIGDTLVERAGNVILGSGGSAIKVNREIVDGQTVIKVDAEGFEGLPAMKKLEVANIAVTADVAQNGPIEDVEHDVLTDIHANGLDALTAIPDEQVFTTTDGREFGADVVRAALVDASIRGAARNLGIGESTLRGWKARL